MTDSLTQVRVLVVDDDPPIRTAITATLKAEGAVVVAVASGSGALEACRRNAFDAVVLDQRIGDQTGLEVLPILLAEAPWMKVVIVTAFASFELAVQAMRRSPRKSTSAASALMSSTPWRFCWDAHRPS